MNEIENDEVCIQEFTLEKCCFLFYFSNIKHEF
jgi:hypothetical protein